jgi:transcriptional regulator GlxA family with amidase domain
MDRKTVGFVALEQVNAVDVTGPAEAFARTQIRISSRSRDTETVQSCYRVLILGVGTGSCVTECSIAIQPHLSLAEAPPLDTLFVCGGSQIHDRRKREKLAKWLKKRIPVTRRVVGIGAGVHELAIAGLLDGREVAVHWRLAKDVALQFPRVRVTPNALFIKDGSFYSCAGGASAIDLSLTLIEEDFGRHTALNVARELIIHLKRSGEQEQYSEALQFQVQSCDRFTDIFTWISCNLDQDLSIEALARRACMSPRNFSRLFKVTFGKAPAEFVAGLRIAEGRRRLKVPRNSIESVANSVGFRSADAFSRAFEREEGCRPSIYRSLLGISAAEDPNERPKVSELLLAHA